MNAQYERLTGTAGVWVVGKGMLERLSERSLMTSGGSGRAVFE